MDTQNNNEELLIPPAVSVQSINPPPPPLNPPTKDDVDRALSFKKLVEQSSFDAPALRATVDDVNNSNAYYIRLRERYEQSLGLDNITLADAVREFRQSFRELNAKLDRVDQRLNERLNGVEQQMSSVEQQMVRQVETNIRLVQQWVAREDLVSKRSYEINRDATRKNRPGSEVPFVDGSRPSSKGLPALTSAADIDSLTLEQARELAVGHGIRAARMSEERIKDRLTADLGFSVQQI
ncbi:uncharacterized protein V1513DRAFT_427022 [Lipomyces chichibuensis]|uniref:uncharacterized protein n=1 Tax=Lipomyces chichibuensis TaxID=1546026 RepID=UPI003343AFB4